MKDRDFRKNKKRNKKNINFGVHMSKKYQL